MECEGTFRFSFPSAKKALEAKKALGNGGPETRRSKTRVSVKGKELVVEISATDSVALRAAANSCLRHLKVIEEIGV
jgi:tRNA threonylcarbamoyladenosine modification (KEOPS) complex  Pcc1 subunit